MDKHASNLFKLSPLGINNPSNFCYIISSLQLLINCKSFIYSLSLFKEIDKNITLLLTFFGLENNIYSREDIINIVNANQNLLTQNTELKKSILKKLKLSSEELTRYIDIIKLYGNQIYIYVYIIKFILKYIDIQESSNNTKDENDSDNTLMNNLSSDFMAFLKVSNKALSNIGIDELIDGNQHDAHEFLITFIDIINDTHSFIKSNPLPSNISSLTDKEFNELPVDKRINIGIKKTFYNLNKNGYSILKNNLYFYTAQIINCNNCNFNSISFQENSMLNLPIPDTKEQVTIYNCLDKYFNLEFMDNEYKCEKCSIKKTNNKLSKQLMTKPNDILIYFKRFDFDIKSMSMTKNKTNIKYPYILNLQKYYANISNLHNENNKILYKLKSVICHRGTLNYGHYYNFVSKTNELNNDEWYLCNDENIEKLNTEHIDKNIINNDAYILCYELV